jgi:hypothetical protein
MVINVKWGVYAAGAALLLAFTTSLALGQASFGVAILRALAFAGIFFILGTGAWTLINNYMPELLFPETNDAAANIFGTEPSGSGSPDSQSYGSHVNITLGEGSDAALPDNNGADPDEVGNISDLVSGAVNPAEEAKRQRGLDGISESSYNGIAEETAITMAGFAEPVPAPTAEEGGGFSMNFDSFALGGGPTGLEPFGDSFSLPPDSGAAAKEDDVFVPERKVMGNTPMALEGDFNPKDIALGIRTVLETDKKG